MYNKNAIKEKIYTIIDPLIDLMVSLGVSPNGLTTFGVSLNVIAIFYLNNWFLKSVNVFGENMLGYTVLLFFGSIMDMFDGRMARNHGMNTKFGAYFDSCMDRYSELIMFIGLAYYFFNFEMTIGAIWLMVASMGSIMVSYNRSRAETLGVRCEVGLMQRPERLVLMMLLCLVIGISEYFDWVLVTKNDSTLDPVNVYIKIYAILINATAIRRILHVQNQLEG